MGLSAEAYARMLKALLPPGRIWRLEAESGLSKVMLGAADELVRVDGRADDIIRESDPRTTDELLPDFEEELGLVVSDRKVLSLVRASSQYAAISDAAQTGLDVTGALTIEALIRIGNIAGLADNSQLRIVSKNQVSGDQRGFYATLIRPALGQHRLMLAVTELGTGGTGFEYTVDISSLVPIGEWHRVAFRFNPAGGAGIGDRAAIFVDGAEVPELSAVGGAASSIANNTAEFAVGRESAGSDYWQGEIADLRVWSRALSDAEIANGATSATDLEGNWPLNGDYNDRSSNLNHLTASGSPVFLAIPALIEERRAHVVSRLLLRQRVRPADYQEVLAPVLGLNPEDVEIIEHSRAHAIAVGDDQEIYRFFVFRDPVLPGFYDIAQAQAIVDEISHSHTKGYVIESDNFLCDDPFSLTDRDILGV